MNYTESKHRHRFAAWCASTAARQSPKCRFSVEDGFKIIERGHLDLICEGWHKIEKPKNFDNWHEKTRYQIIDAAREILPSERNGKELPPDKGFKHGVAAKLINVYLKLCFLPVHKKGYQKRISPKETQSIPLLMLFLQRDCGK